jgi:hypothetical protein
MNTVSTHRRSAWVAAGLLVTLSLIAATSAAFAQSAPSAAVTAGAQPPATSAQASSTQVPQAQTSASLSSAAREDQVMVPETATDTPPARR